MTAAVAKPTVLAVNPEGIPRALKAVAQWVVWRLERRDGKWTKVPRNLKNGREASSTDPETWGTFGDAMDAYRNNIANQRIDRPFDGIGFVFHHDDDFAGIDLDHCYDGEVADWALDIVADFDTYTEFSPSGTGLHTVLIGAKPGPKCKQGGFPNGGAVEVYDHARYLCITGHRLPGKPPEVNDCQNQLHALYARLFHENGEQEQPKTKRNADAARLRGGHDGEVILKVQAKQQYACLWNGDTSAYDGDESRADLALCSRLAFFCGNDSSRIDRLFRESKLYREKWERQDYRDRTISAAIEGCREFYNWQAKGANHELGSGFELRMIDSATFANTSYKQRFLCKKILVHGQPCIAGGPKKVLKTSVVVDLMISLGTGSPFLGEFEVPEPVPVGILSGESGGYVLQETARRICRARGRVLSASNCWWGFDLPQLSDGTHLDALRAEITKFGLQAIAIDPAYLCMLEAAQANLAGNVFAMGSLLKHIADVGRDTDCTIILIHHTRKNLQSPFGPPELEDLAQAGFAEFARQWLLLNRRKPYEAGTGHHPLWLNVGGSAGHSGLYAVNVEEGAFEPGKDRDWKVAVLSSADARAEAAAKREQEKVAKDREKLLEALRLYPDGETQTTLRDAAGLSGKVTTRLIAELRREGLVADCLVKKTKREFDGFKLTRTPGQNPDSPVGPGGAGYTRTDGLFK